MGKSNAPKRQASTRTAQTTNYTKEDPYDSGKNEKDMYDMQDSSYLNQPPSYNQVHQPECLWQWCFMEVCRNEFETFDEF